MSIKEILEISKWLHERGFEPDMWEWNKSLHKDIYLLERWRINPEFFYQERQPYFTLNRALELLPDRIGKYTYVQWRKNRIGYICDQMNQEYEWGYEELIKGNTHLAALRLLKQVVEKGYLKGGGGLIMNKLKIIPIHHLVNQAYQVVIEMDNGEIIEITEPKTMANGSIYLALERAYVYQEHYYEWKPKKKWWEFWK